MRAASDAAAASAAAAAAAAPAPARATSSRRRCSPVGAYVDEHATTTVTAADARALSCRSCSSRSSNTVAQQQLLRSSQLVSSYGRAPTISEPNACVEQHPRSHRAVEAVAMAVASSLLLRQQQRRLKDVQLARAVVSVAEAER